MVPRRPRERHGQAVTSPTATDKGTTYAVLGGKGFVGSAIVAELESRGHEVTAIDIDEYAENVGKTFDVLINANGNSKKYLAKQDPAKEFDLSVRSVANALQDFTFGLYVHLSTVDVYVDHTNPANNTEDAQIDAHALSPYGLHKYMAEQLARYYPEKWLVFRMAGFVGPGLWKNSIYDLIKGESLRVNPDSGYQYLHTRDLARIVLDIAASGAQGEIFNVAGDGVISLTEIAGMIPDCAINTVKQDIPKEHYEISIEKIKLYAAPPPTRQTVSEFIQAVLDGKESLR